jgi:hypothetical protein
LGEFLKWIDGVGFQISNALEILGSLKVGDLTFPTADGTLNQVLSTDGAGNLFFQSLTDSMNAIPLPAVQVRRDSDFTPNSTNIWYDLDFNLTDVENDTVSLEHDDSAPDRIKINKSGLFRISYSVNSNSANVTHDLQSRVNLNDATILPGSTFENKNYQSEFSPTTVSFLANLTNGDFISLQVLRTTDNLIVGETILTISKLDGVKGDNGLSYNVDATGTFAERVNFDAEAKGFSFLDVDAGNLFIKKSATSGDWSNAIEFGKGEKGDRGETGDTGPAGANGADGENFEIDAVGNFADRANFDDAAADFTFLDTENSDLYLKNSAASGDWSAAIPFGKINSVPVPIVQARRTTNFTPTAANVWENIEFDATDFENNPTTISHDDVDRAKIEILENGFYQINYQINSNDGSTHTLQTHVFKNSTEILPGSSLTNTNYGNEYGASTASFFAEFVAGDFINLQVLRTTDNEVVDETVLTISKLEAMKGDTGPAGATGPAGPAGPEGPTGPAGQSFTVDANGTFAERANYNLEAAGFSFLDTENGNLYLKNSAANADWSDPVAFGKGEKGDTGETGPPGADGADAPPRTLIQVYDSSGGTDINLATPVAIPFDAESFKDAGFSHSNSTNNSRIVLENAGRYSVFYSISHENTNNSRRTIRCRGRKNGSEFLIPSASHAYSRNSTDKFATNSANFIFQTSAANEYLEILCEQTGSSGTAPLVAGDSWVVVERVF